MLYRSVGRRRICSACLHTAVISCVGKEDVLGFYRLEVVCAIKGGSCLLYNHRWVYYVSNRDCPSVMMYLSFAASVILAIGYGAFLGESCSCDSGVIDIGKEYMPERTMNGIPISKKLIACLDSAEYSRDVVLVQMITQTWQCWACKIASKCV